MKNLFYFVVVISLFFVSCGGNTSSETEKIEKTTNKEQVVEQQYEVISSTVLRVDRIIKRVGSSALSWTILFTEDCRTFTFGDEYNINFANVREGDRVSYKLYNNGETDLVDITYVFNK